MKNLIIVLFLSTVCTLSPSIAASQPKGGKSISVQSTEITLTDANTVGVAFQLHVGEEVAAKNRSMIIRPLLIGGEGQSELPVIIVRGARAKVADENRALSGAGIDSEERYVIANGTVLDYWAQIPWQEWMNGSQLIFNGLNTGNKNATEVNIGVVAENLLTGHYAPTYASAAGTTGRSAISGQATQAMPPIPAHVATVGDELSARFTFVEPVARYYEARNINTIDALFDYNMPLAFGTATIKQDDDMSRFLEMTRLGALHIEFDRGSTTVVRELGKNNRMLVDLISSIRVLGNSPDVKIAQVVAVGFSAPEESADEKETLALERAGVARDFITANSHLDPNVISIYNGSVDWVTLRALVAESNMSAKYNVLDIIDNIPAWGRTQDKGRMARLMELDNGAAFRYIRENFFPKLRQTGAYIKIYYENMR